MKKTFGIVAASILCGSVASAADLNLSVTSPGSAPCGGANCVTVAPGSTVNYEIVGQLSSDADNDGLALFGLNLTFDGGDLAAADIPVGPSSAGNPMPAFVRLEGITNPDSPCPPACGFGGTLIADTAAPFFKQLVQIGGGQNTIKNTATNAPFPIGDTVWTNLGHTPVVLVRGSLTAPAGPPLAEFHLVIPPDSVFANVIRLGETGTPFWATDPAGTQGTITNLTITIGGDIPVADLLVADPACGISWPRSANNFAKLTFDADITLPGAGEVQIRELLAGGTFGADLSANFAFSIVNDGGGAPRVLRIVETGTQLTDRKWYGITNNGWTGVADFKVDIVHLIGDADGNGRVLGLDVSLINSQISPLAQPDKRTDIDGNGRVLGLDFSLANSKISPLAVTKPTGHTCAP